jgi:hypothetical protein
MARWLNLFEVRTTKPEDPKSSILSRSTRGK